MFILFQSPPDGNIFKNDQSQLYIYNRDIDKKESRRKAEEDYTGAPQNNVIGTCDWYVWSESDVQLDWGEIGQNITNLTNKLLEIFWKSIKWKHFAALTQHSKSSHISVIIV